MRLFLVVAVVCAVTVNCGGLADGGNQEIASRACSPLYIYHSTIEAPVQLGRRSQRSSPSTSTLDGTCVNQRQTITPWQIFSGSAPMWQVRSTSETEMARFVYDISRNSSYWKVGSSRIPDQQRVVAVTVSTTPDIPAADNTNGFIEHEACKLDATFVLDHIVAALIRGRVNILIIPTTDDLVLRWQTWLNYIPPLLAVVNHFDAKIAVVKKNKKNERLVVVVKRGMEMLHSGSYASCTPKLESQRLELDRVTETTSKDPEDEVESGSRASCILCLLWFGVVGVFFQFMF